MRRHKRYRGQIKTDKDKEYDHVEKDPAGKEDFRRPAYAVKHAIRDQAERIRETPAEYIARKYGIGGEVNGKEERAEKSGKDD